MRGASLLRVGILCAVLRGDRLRGYVQRGEHERIQEGRGGWQHGAASPSRCWSWLDDGVQPVQVARVRFVVTPGAVPVVPGVAEEEELVHVDHEAGPGDALLVDVATHAQLALHVQLAALAPV